MDQHILRGQGLRSPHSLAPELSTSLQIKSWCLAAAIVALKVSLRIVGDLHNGIMEGLGVRQRTDTVRKELNSRLHSYGLDRSTHPAPAELPFRSAKNFSDTQTCPKPNSPNPHPDFWPTWAAVSHCKEQRCCFSQTAMQWNGDFCCSVDSPVKISQIWSKACNQKTYLSIRFQDQMIRAMQSK